MTPFPMPLTTPPDTRMYFVIAAGVQGEGVVVAGAQALHSSQTRARSANFPFRFSVYDICHKYAQITRRVAWVAVARRVTLLSFFPHIPGPRAHGARCSFCAHALCWRDLLLEPARIIDSLAAA